VANILAGRRTTRAPSDAGWPTVPAPELRAMGPGSNDPGEASHFRPARRRRGLLPEDLIIRRSWS
jgi:hypothetical protein